MDYPILPSDSISDILHHLKEVYVRTIDDTLSLSSIQTLSNVSQMMKQYKYIDIYASAGNLFFADNFKFQMQEIGVHVHVPHEEYMLGITASNASNEHLSFVISFEGHGHATSKICRLLHELDSPIVLITSTKQNPLTKYATEIIYMSSYEDHYQKVSSFSTRMTLLYILDTLYSLYFSQNYEVFLKKKISSYQRLSSSK